MNGVGLTTVGLSRRGPWRNLEEVEYEQAELLGLPTALCTSCCCQSDL